MPAVATDRSARLPASAPYDADEDIQHLDTVTAPLRERRPRHERRERRGVRPFELRAELAGVREPRQVGQAQSRDHLLVLGAAERPRQLLEKLDLSRRASREIRMPDLGWRGDEPAVDVVQQRLAQTRAGGDHRGVAVRLPRPFLQDRKLVRLEHGDRRRHRLQIVQERQATEAEPLRDGARVDHPRHVGQARHVARDDARDAERDFVDAVLVRFGEKRVDHVLNRLVIERGELRRR